MSQQTAARSASATGPSSKAELAAYIDQTNLGLGVSAGEMRPFLTEAVRLGFRAVCVLPNMVPLAAHLTRGTPVRVAGVVSFPLGADVPAVKAAEARGLADMGADEIDMVIDVSAARDGDADRISEEVAAVRASLRDGQLVKVIIEMPLLTPKQSITAALAAERGGAHIVKTSTGFKGLHIRGTTVEDVQALRRVLRPETGIKAAGGIRTTQDALSVIAAGATRIGTSSGVAILAGFSDQ